MLPLAESSPLEARSERRRAASRRSLLPREHGAYGQLATPLVAALAMGHPGLSAIALTLAGGAAFVAHEPLLVAVGQRGGRARREDGARARTWLAALGGAAIAIGAAGLFAAPAAARVAAGVPIALAALLAPFIARRAEKTLAGELVAVAALASVAVPVAIASGVPEQAAWSAWLVWCAGFGGATASVRVLLVHRRAPMALLRRLVPAAVAALVIGALAFEGRIPAWSALAAAPMLAVAAAIGAIAPHPRAMHRVGWSLVASSVVAVVVIALGAR